MPPPAASRAWPELTSDKRGRARLSLAAVPASPVDSLCAVFAVDIAGFTRPDRDDDIRRYLHEKLYEYLRKAFEDSDLPWEECFGEDRGDGALIVVPPGISFKGLIRPLPERLRSLIRRHNHVSRELRASNSGPRSTSARWTTTVMASSVLTSTSRSAYWRPGRLSACSPPPVPNLASRSLTTFTAASSAAIPVSCTRTRSGPSGSRPRTPGHRPGPTCRRVILMLDRPQSRSAARRSPCVARSLVLLRTSL